MSRVSGNRAHFYGVVAGSPAPGAWIDPNCAPTVRIACSSLYYNTNADPGVRIYRIPVEGKKLADKTCKKESTVGAFFIRSREHCPTSKIIFPDSPKTTPDSGRIIRTIFSRPLARCAPIIVWLPTSAPVAVNAPSVSRISLKMS